MLGLLSTQDASADLMLGLLNDFEDGTLQGWDPPKNNTANVAGGPSGSTRFLEVSPAPRMAAFSTAFAGTIDPSVTDIFIDMMRPSGQSDLEMRMVLFGPGADDRWTSTDAVVVPGDGAWATYSFSVREADLTRVLGSSTYADLTSNFAILMFRWDQGTPSAGGSVGVSGTIGYDNITAVPQAGTGALVAMGLGLVGLLRRHS